MTDYVVNSKMDDHGSLKVSFLTDGTTEFRLNLNLLLWSKNSTENVNKLII